MHGLKQARTIATEGGGGQHSNRPRKHRSLIAEDVAKQVARQQHVELAGVTHQLHRRIVHVHVADIHLAITRRHRINAVPPKLAHIQNIGFIHGTKAIVSFSSDLKSHLGNAIHL